ncbi:MAG TPA: glycosyltransferase family A protein [Pirellulaceae bacterium]|nr:glycosyltransferase family A protein [Pirellulaceae bacterium]
MTRPTITALIPCYNRQATIARAIESVLAQTIPVTEILVIDDGSRDDSAAVAAAFGQPVRVIRTLNNGAAVARNNGLSEAQGEWIAFLDSDDYWHPHKLELQLAAAERYPDANLIFCDTRSLQAEQVLMPSRFALGGLHGQEVASHGKFAKYDRRLFTAMLTASRVITSAVMVRRDIPDLNFPAHIWGSEDWALWLTLALRQTFASVDEVLVDMQVAGDNLTRHIGRIMRNDVQVLEDLLNHPEVTPDEKSAVAQELTNRRVAAVYHSLVQGEGAEVRRLLTNGQSLRLATMKKLAYYVASYLPARTLRSLAPRAELSQRGAAVNAPAR